MFLTTESPERNPKLIKIVFFLFFFCAQSHSHSGRPQKRFSENCIFRWWYRHRWAIRIVLAPLAAILRHVVARDANIGRQLLLGILVQSTPMYHRTIPGCRGRARWTRQSSCCFWAISQVSPGRAPKISLLDGWLLGCSVAWLVRWLVAWLVGWSTTVNSSQLANRANHQSTNPTCCALGSTPWGHAL